MQFARVAQLCDLQVEDLEPGFLATGPAPFLHRPGHKVPLAECSGEHST